jgi:hypothetical protein
VKCSLLAAVFLLLQVSASSADRKRPPINVKCDRGNPCEKGHPVFDAVDWIWTCEYEPLTGPECRSSRGPCDVPEYCQAGACPTDGFSAIGTRCRDPNGPCDLADVCTGDSIDCFDQFLPPTAVCASPTWPCELPHYCTGLGPSCPEVKIPKPTGAICRASAGPCDRVEVCSGESLHCPIDAIAPKTALCRPAFGVCDVAEYCTGTDVSCPTNQLREVGVSCRALIDSCDLEEFCTGEDANCPEDRSFPDGHPCDDQDICTSGDVCIASNCSGEPIDSCDHATAPAGSAAGDASAVPPPATASPTLAGQSIQEQGCGVVLSGGWYTLLAALSFLLVFRNRPR